MDARLIAWARRVKRRSGDGLPTLWLFTDAVRLPDPRPAIARLPRGLCGVVLRHDGMADRARLGRDLAQLCRARRAVLVVAGDARLARAIGAGLHLRGGRPAGVVSRRGLLVTSSVHDAAQIRRADRHGARLMFLSPLHATASHPGCAGLGPCRWTALARQARGRVAALGGIDGVATAAIPRYAAAIGAIGAFTNVARR